ncbi:MAG TPA: DUF4013 domain-containing protein [Chloroflexota bacterium]|nr:DUF4013 domain-containing protein [Chloroflexota bacterium]HUM68806.1 DUF4013 domain-containing protein [Chloroflexota bacterium]
MDIGKALTYITEDERWVMKFLIALAMAIFSFFIIPAIILEGYMVAIARNVMNGEERPLPEWDDWGGFLRDGFNLFVALLVYTLPFWLLACIVGISTIGFSGLSNISEDAAAAGILATFGLVSCLALIFLLALLFVSPAVIVQYLRNNNLGSCFRFGEVFGIVRDHIGDIAIVVGVVFAIMFVTGLVANIPCIGWIVSFLIGPYLAVVWGHLYGQIAAKAGGASKEEKFAA